MNAQEGEIDPSKTRASGGDFEEEYKDQVDEIGFYKTNSTEKPRLESLSTIESMSFKNNLNQAKPTLMSEKIANIKDKEQLKSKSERIVSMQSLSKQPSQQDKEPTIEDYEIGAVLGRGAYGVVNLATEKDTGIQVAIKSVSREQVSSLGKERHIFREKELLNSLDHPTIIKLLKTFKDDNNLYFVFEHAENGTLDDFIKFSKNKLGEELARILFA